MEANRRKAIERADSGFHSYRAGHFHNALVDDNEAIELDPWNPYLLYSRGTVQGWLGRYDEAITDLNEAIRLKPDFQEAYAGLSSTAAWKMRTLAHP